MFEMSLFLGGGLWVKVITQSCDYEPVIQDQCDFVLWWNYVCAVVATKLPLIYQSPTII